MKPTNAWRSGLPHEVEFWTQWVETKGREWPDEYRRRLDQSEPLPDLVRAQLDPLGKDSYRILDIGAGPVSVLGTSWPGKEILLVPVDPLADTYDQLLERHGVKPPVRTTWCTGELLIERFKPNSFDLVYAQNSLDHTYDPVLCIVNALAVARVGSSVVLVHAINEGENEHYQGLHQWNFCAEGNDFIIWSRWEHINVSRLLHRHDVKCHTIGGGIQVVVRKREDSVPQLAARFRGMVRRLTPYSLYHDARAVVGRSLSRLSL